MKALRFGIASIMAVALMMGSSPADAAPSNASCLVTGYVSFVPGLGTTPQQVEYKSEEGLIQCSGAVGGAAVSGNGTLTEKGDIEGTALAGTGFGTTTVEIPTSEGPKSVTFDNTFTYGPGIGSKNSDSLEGPWTFVFFPTSGDGVIAPVTKIAVIGQFILKSDSMPQRGQTRCDLDAVVIRVNCRTTT
jgi:hypothetical protein